MASRYWVGGTANWDGTAGTKWALTSGGAGGQAVPTSADDVFFDATSGAITVTTPISVTNNCRDLDCTGFTGTLAFTDGNIFNKNTLNIYGSLTLVAGMTIITMPNILAFKSTSTGKTITSAGKNIFSNNANDSLVNFDGIGGGWVFQDDITIDVNLVNGTLDTNGKTVTTTQFVDTGTATRGLILGASTVLITSTDGQSSWALTSTGMTLDAGTSVLRFQNSSNGRLFIDGGGLTYNNIWLDRGASTGMVIFSGSYTFNDFKYTGTAAFSIFLMPGITLTVNTFTVSGSAGNLLTIGTANATGTPVTTTHNYVKNGGGVISSDYLNIQHCIATPASTWYAGTHSTDNQSVASAGSGWIFTAPPPQVFVGGSSASGLKILGW